MTDNLKYFAKELQCRMDTLIGKEYDALNREQGILLATLAMYSAFYEPRYVDINSAVLCNNGGSGITVILTKLMSAYDITPANLWIDIVSKHHCSDMTDFLFMDLSEIRLKLSFLDYSWEDQKYLFGRMQNDSCESLLNYILCLQDLCALSRARTFPLVFSYTDIIRRFLFDCRVFRQSKEVTHELLPIQFAIQLYMFLEYEQEEKIYKTFLNDNLWILSIAALCGSLPISGNYLYQVLTSTTDFVMSLTARTRTSMKNLIYFILSGTHSFLSVNAERSNRISSNFVSMLANAYESLGGGVGEVYE